MTVVFADAGKWRSGIAVDRGSEALHTMSEVGGGEKRFGPFRGVSFLYEVPGHHNPGHDEQRAEHDTILQ